MNIKVILVDEPSFLAKTGGGCAQTDCYVNIGSGLDERSQIETVLHEILEAHLWLLEHDKIDDLTDALMDGLDQLNDITTELE